MESVLPSRPPYWGLIYDFRSVARLRWLPLKMEKNPIKCIGLYIGASLRRRRLWLGSAPRMYSPELPSPVVCTPGISRIVRIMSAVPRNCGKFLSASACRINRPDMVPVIALRVRPAVTSTSSSFHIESARFFAVCWRQVSWLICALI